MSAYVDLLMCVKIIQEHSSWSGQCGQVCHRVEVADHYISQCPHLRVERNCVH